MRGNDKLAELVKSYYSSLKMSRSKRAVLAISLSLLAFWLQLLFPAMGVDDDWGMSVLLSNSYPDSGYTLFIHPWLSAFVSFLYGVLPWGPNYFMLVEICLSFAATAIVIYFAIGHLRIGGMLGVLTVMLIFGVPYSTQHINFTVITSLLASAGLIIMFVQLFERRCAVLPSVAGAAFLGAACMFRLEAVLLCGPAFFALVVVSLVRTKDVQLKERLRLFAPLASALVLCGFLAVSSAAIMQQPGLSEWQSAAASCSELVDFYSPKPYGEIADRLAEVDVSENDYWMVRQRSANDTGFFTPERLGAIADIACQNPSISAGSILKACAAYVMRLGARPYMSLAIAASLMMLFGAWRRSPRLEKWASVVVLALTIAMAVYLEMTGRILLRVEYPIWIYGMIVLAVLAGAGGPLELRGKHAATGVGMLAAGALLSFVVALSTYMGAISSPDISTVKSLFGASQESKSQLMKYQREHTDCVFAYDYDAMRAWEDLYNKRCMPSRDLTAQTQLLGGWECGAAFLDEAVNAKTGLDCGLMENLAKSGKVFMVAVGDEHANHMLTYIREHYNPAAEMRVVDVIEDTKMGKTFKVIRFATP